MIVAGRCILRSGLSLWLGPNAARWKDSEPRYQQRSAYREVVRPSSISSRETSAPSLHSHSSLSISADYRRFFFAVFEVLAVFRLAVRFFTVARRDLVETVLDFTMASDPVPFEG